MITVDWRSSFKSKVFNFRISIFVLFLSLYFVIVKLCSLTLNKKYMGIRWILTAVKNLNKMSLFSLFSLADMMSKGYSNVLKCKKLYKIGVLWDFREHLGSNQAIFFDHLQELFNTVTVVKKVEMSTFCRIQIQPKVFKSKSTAQNVCLSLFLNT